MSLPFSVYFNLLNYIIFPLKNKSFSERSGENSLYPSLINEKEILKFFKTIGR